MMQRVALLFLLFFGSSYQAKLNSSELLQVSIITRHGARAPEKPNPGDPFPDPAPWPNGWMHLTEEGVQQMKDLGAWTKRRYSHFLPQEYAVKNIEARSTDTSRTLASAVAFLSTLYPNTAIPVYSAPSTCDFILSSYKSCPEYQRQLIIYENSQEFKRLEKKWQPTYDYLTEVLGRHIHTSAAVESLYSRLKIGKLRGWDLPKWSRLVFPEPLRSIAVAHSSVGGSTVKMARLRYGPLLNKIFKRKSLLKAEEPRLMLFSAHDFTIAGLLKSMDAFDNNPVEFAAAVIFEIYTNGSVKILYKNSDQEPVALKLPGCGEVCDEKLIVEKILEPILPGDRNAECKIQPNETASYSLDVLIMLGVALTAAAFGAIIIICVSRTFNVFKVCEPSRTKHLYTAIPGNNIADKYVFQ